MKITRQSRQIVEFVTFTISTFHTKTLFISRVQKNTVIMFLPVLVDDEMFKWIRCDDYFPDMRAHTR